jgi:AcrR family transcriptional regulator
VIAPSTVQHLNYESTTMGRPYPVISAADIVQHVRSHRRVSKYHANYFRVGISWVAQGVCGPAHSDKSAMFMNELVPGLVPYIDRTSVFQFLLGLMVEYAEYVSDVLARHVFRKVCWDCELEDPQWGSALHRFHSCFARHLSAAALEDVVDWSQDDHEGEPLYWYIDPGVVRFLMQRNLITPRLATSVRERLQASVEGGDPLGSTVPLGAGDDSAGDDVHLNSAARRAREEQVLRMLCPRAA